MGFQKRSEPFFGKMPQLTAPRLFPGFGLLCTILGMFLRILAWRGVRFPDGFLSTRRGLWGSPNCRLIRKATDSLMTKRLPTMQTRRRSCRKTCPNLLTIRNLNLAPRPIKTKIGGGAQFQTNWWVGVKGHSGATGNGRRKARNKTEGEGRQKNKSRK